MNRYLEKLEFNKILENLSSHCVTYLGKELALNLLPKYNHDQVQMLLNETQEAVNLIYRNSTPIFYEIKNIDVELKNLESNLALSCKSLLDLNLIFKSAYELKQYVNKDYVDMSTYPILNNLFNALYSNKSIIDKITSCILDENTIDDNASSKLKSIRKNQKKLEQDIKNKLNNMIHSSKYSKYVQESIVTIRNDRFVIPIKEEYRSFIKGFIHDISNAGSTVFIEPTSIFEMNNELNSLKIEEELEIEQILLELSSLFSPYVDELKLDINLIGKLDFIFAKAKYSKKLKAITPHINKNKQINLIEARHPLIDTELVVPITVNLGKDFSTLLITGPNTGGKTVSMKTVGLLCSMACSGLNIPAKENSSIYVFDNIFADIGDDQSINNSLSTFSSHILNIVEITKCATTDSLILVDELGSGTDPIEGANLAISILDYFKNIGALTIATTHYQELKQYALVTNGFQNASVEFNVDTLTPTYKLLVGIPGKSNAFEISKNLGLDIKIIEDAKSHMSSEQTNIEELLKSIYDDKIEIEKEKQELEDKLKHISFLEKSLVKDNENLQRQEQELINNAKIKARNILLDAKEDATKIIKELTLLNNTDLKQADKLRNDLNSKIKDINISNNDSTSDKKSNLDIKDIKPNLEVFVKSLGKNRNYNF
jgi:DNA mismatch repair protein MutS2